MADQKDAIQSAIQTEGKKFCRSPSRWLSWQGVLLSDQWSYDRPSAGTRRKSWYHFKTYSIHLTTVGLLGGRDGRPYLPFFSFFLLLDNLYVFT